MLIKKIAAIEVIVSTTGSSTHLARSEITPKEPKLEMLKLDVALPLELRCEGSGTAKVVKCARIQAFLSTGGTVAIGVEVHEPESLPWATNS